MRYTFTYWWLWLVSTRRDHLISFDIVFNYTEKIKSPISILVLNRRNSGSGNNRTSKKKGLVQVMPSMDSDFEVNNERDEGDKYIELYSLMSTNLFKNNYNHFYSSTARGSETVKLSRETNISYNLRNRVVIKQVGLICKMCGNVLNTRRSLPFHIRKYHRVSVILKRFLISEVEFSFPESDSEFEFE